MALYIIVAILGLAFLIVVHEAGHFFVARALGMRVFRFSVGFGPKLWGVKRGDTEYQLAAIPLGGFVHINGLGPQEQEPDNPRDLTNYQNRGMLARAAVLLAGPMANFLSTVVFLTVLYMAGVPSATDKAIVGQVLEDHPAALAGLQTGDRFVEIDGKAIESWDEMAEAIEASAGNAMAVVVMRGEERLELSIKPKVRDGGEGYIIGIGAGTEVVRIASPFGAALAALERSVLQSITIVTGIWDMARGAQKGEVLGPPGIVKETAKAAKRGLFSFLNIIIYINLALFVFNLLPVPALDGGRIFFIGLEAVRRKRLAPDLENNIHGVGLMLLLALMVVVSVKDLFFR